MELAMRDSKRGITSEGADEISDVLLRSAFPCKALQSYNCNSNCQVKSLQFEETPRSHVTDLLYLLLSRYGGHCSHPNQHALEVPSKIC